MDNGQFECFDRPSNQRTVAFASIGFVYSDDTLRRGGVAPEKCGGCSEFGSSFADHWAGATSLVSSRRLYRPLSQASEDGALKDFDIVQARPLS